RGKKQPCRVRGRGEKTRGRTRGQTWGQAGDFLPTRMRGTGSSSIRRGVGACRQGEVRGPARKIRLSPGRRNRPGEPGADVGRGYEAKGVVFAHHAQGGTAGRCGVFVPARSTRQATYTTGKRGGPSDRRLSP